MKDQHRATPEQWQAIKANGHLPTRSTILELLHRIEALEATQHAHIDLSHLSDAEREKMLKSMANPGRFEALEAAQQAHLIDPEREKAAQEMSQSCGFITRSSEGELRPATRLHSYKVGKAEPIENWGIGHTLVDPPVYAEASNNAKSADSQPQPNHPAKPDSSLVDWVAFAIYPDGSGDGFREEAREAIREVANWLSQASSGHLGSGEHWAIRLKQEAER